MRPVLEVEVWSDVVCPWCYIGKRRFERAVAEVADEVEVRLVPERAAQIIDHVSTVAAGDGLEFRMDRAIRANTLMAHRLLWLTTATGHQQALKERLLQAYFCDGLDVGDPDVLADCAADVGLDRDTVRAFLDSTDGVDQVREQLAFAHDNGITAVPTYVFGTPGSEQRWMVPGAQDSELFVRALRRLAERAGDDS
jgi:predicted DsbA family dithiol-disulfide isomerase